MFELLKKYTELPGPIGHEDRVQNEFFKDLKKFTDKIQITNVGNVIAHFPGKRRKVIILGHADEICSSVLSITDNGFLHISTLLCGRTDKIQYPYCIVGQKALVIGDKEDIRGAFVAPSCHVLRITEREMPLEDWNILVDIGAFSKDEVIERGIHVGSPVIWNPITENLGKVFIGKAMDDRISHFIMIELAKKLEGNEINCDLYMASTIQEEIGGLGAQALARYGYDVSIALDIGIAGDYPTLPAGRAPINLGGGPVIVYRDSKLHYNLKIIQELRATAERNAIPYQHGLFIGYFSDSAFMIAGGTKPNLIAPPCRYSHMPVEMVHKEDLENTIKLLYHYVTDKNL